MQNLNLGSAFSTRFTAPRPNLEQIRQQREPGLLEELNSTANFRQTIGISSTLQRVRLYDKFVQIYNETRSGRGREWDLSRFTDLVELSCRVLRDVVARPTRTGSYMKRQSMNRIVLSLGSIVNESLYDTEGRCTNCTVGFTAGARREAYK
jgi:hypothetical protein